MKEVGYLVKYPNRLEGERGMFFDYVLASNGLFIEAEGKLLGARVPVALCEVRGLMPLEPKVVLRYGRIPQRFFDLAMSSFLIDTHRERYVAVTWNEGYHLYAPEQKIGEAQVEYLMGDAVMPCAQDEISRRRRRLCQESLILWTRLGCFNLGTAPR